MNSISSSSEEDPLALPSLQDWLSVRTCGFCSRKLVDSSPASGSGCRY